MTEKQKKIYDIILSHNGDISGLSLRKIGEITGLHHPQSVAYQIKALENKGFLERLSKGVYRVISLDLISPDKKQVKIDRLEKENIFLRRELKKIKQFISTIRTKYEGCSCDQVTEFCSDCISID